MHLAELHSWEGKNEELGYAVADSIGGTVVFPHPKEDNEFSSIVGVDDPDTIGEGVAGRIDRRARNDKSHKTGGNGDRDAGSVFPGLRGCVPGL